ncbi:hypothetical protein SKAU_G00094980 [Synaphobranchus kaupii]|uniref:HAT C-terminal dimerisation domain-containing protein n=1 Tax=Synaphobranchus kaupii TaxID=118154 RepID=A0A9Q1FXF4_SYNKA|nr:hypothetical protein SKAU_G00094980 [Synaphobranchus kaupii]
MSGYFTWQLKLNFSLLVLFRDSLPTLCGNRVSQQQGKKRRTQGPDELQRIATEVCDTILGHAKERFSFTKHLISATLLQGDKFQQYNSQFPEAALNTTMEAYPLLNKSKLKTELALIYSNDEFKSCSGAVALYQLFMGNNLQDTFSETVALLKIIITTPMTTAESERCFSTLKRIKTSGTQCHRIISMHWPCSLWRRNSSKTSLTLTIESLRNLHLSRREGRNLCTKRKATRWHMALSQFTELFDGTGSAIM